MLTTGPGSRTWARSHQLPAHAGEIAAVVPSNLSVASARRLLLDSAFMQKLTTPQMTPMLKDSKAQMLAIDRAFGADSAGMGKRDGDAQ